jgi:hypothetical protein
LKRAINPRVAPFMRFEILIEIGDESVRAEDFVVVDPDCPNENGFKFVPLEKTKFAVTFQLFIVEDETDVRFAIQHSTLKFDQNSVPIGHSTYPDTRSVFLLTVSKKEIQNNAYIPYVNSSMFGLIYSFALNFVVPPIHDEEFERNEF